MRHTRRQTIMQSTNADPAQRKSALFTLTTKPRSVAQSLKVKRQMNYGKCKAKADRDTRNQ